MNIKTITNVQASENLRNGIAKVRVDLDMSQEEFAHLIGVSKSTIQRIENGERKLRACLLEIKLYNTTGLTYFDLMRVEDSRISLCRRIRNLDEQKFKIVESLVNSLEKL